METRMTIEFQDDPERRPCFYIVKWTGNTGETVSKHASEYEAKLVLQKLQNEQACQNP